MKALSLRQPWAWLVVHGGKSIENRRWNTRFRGEFLIHAARGMTQAEYADAREFVRLVAGWNAVRNMPMPQQLERGYIIGRARLVDVIPPCGSFGEPRTINANLFQPDACPHPWHMPEQFGFVLSDVRPVGFTPCRGELGFFEVDDLCAEVSP